MSAACAYLIAGAGGMLGSALQRELARGGCDWVAPKERSFDITDERIVAEVVRTFAASRPVGTEGVLINAAAYTDVERAEDEPHVAYEVNERGARVLAHEARSCGLRFVHVSTDFVFDGEKSSPYAEDDVPNPLSAYGSSKLAGEHSVFAADPDALIVRTAWVFGENGTNFPLKVLARARERGELAVVTDELGSPTYTADLARGLIGLVETGERGLFHLAGAGACSRYDLAAETVACAGLEDVHIAPVFSASLVTKARRPKNSCLDCSKAARLGVTMPDWRDGLQRFVASAGG